MSFRFGMEASTAKRVPSTIRADPKWAANQLLRRCAGVMALCMATMALSPKWAKRWRTLASSWGVRLISGTSNKTWACGASSSTKAARRKYTSVLPLPVLPCNKNGPLCCASCANTCVCSGVRGGTGAFSVLTAANGLRRESLRSNCSAVMSRKDGGKQAMANSPALRW